jgi:hypothetical protein
MSESDSSDNENGIFRRKRKNKAKENQKKRMKGESYVGQTKSGNEKTLVDKEARKVGKIFKC